MAKNKRKYYVVWHGETPGIYETWDQCQLQIKGYPGAQYKSYPTLDEAQQAYQSRPDLKISGAKAIVKSSPKVKTTVDPQLVHATIAVDAACSGNPGDMEYRGVRADTGEQLFHQGPFEQGTNNVGEFLALVHALAMLEAKGDETTVIWTDSMTALAWVRNKKVKTTLTKTPANEILFKLMDRAILWLHDHSYGNPIKKWDTVAWGEIPADFGRK